MRILAVFASLVLAGAGHFILGQLRRGLGWVLLSLAFALSVPFAPVFGLLAGLLARIVNAVDVFLMPRAQGRIPWRTVLVSWTILAAVALWSVLARELYVQPFRITSASMSPTLLPGDNILVNKFIYHFRDLRRGDVIVFRTPWDDRVDFVKRVIAFGGEEVAVKDRTVFINGRSLTEPYAVYTGRHPSRNGGFDYGPVLVPPESYFVLGDNRDDSQDSRRWGFLKREKIVGQSFVIYWSWDREKMSLRWSRLGREIAPNGAGP